MKNLDFNKVNYKGENYPEGLAVLDNQAEELAQEIVKISKSENCFSLGELYTYNKTKNITTRNLAYFREKSIYQANIYRGKKEQIKDGPLLTPNEFKGLYIFFDGDIPVYVGISRSVYRRLRQHGWGKKHNQCSLAYLMAKYVNGDIERSTVHKVHEDELTVQKDKIRNYKVVLHPVSCNYELYFLEIALAIKLKTKWNSFKTH